MLRNPHGLPDTTTLPTTTYDPAGTLRVIQPPPLVGRALWTCGPGRPRRTLWSRWASYVKRTALWVRNHRLILPRASVAMSQVILTPYSEPPVALQCCSLLLPRCSCFTSIFWTHRYCFVMKSHDTWLRFRSSAPFVQSIVPAVCELFGFRSLRTGARGTERSALESAEDMVGAQGLEPRTSCV